MPAAVTSLQSSKTQTSVTLTWETKADTYQDNFRVRYKGTATSTSWSSPEDVQEKEKMYDGLLPGDKYMFEVWARSGTNDSTKGNITVVLGEIQMFLYSYTGAALCNAHGQCDHIFAKFGDGHLRQ